MYPYVCRSSTHLFHLLRISPVAVRAYSAVSTTPSLLLARSPFNVPSCSVRTQGSGGHHEKPSSEEGSSSDHGAEKPEEGKEEETGEQQKKREIDPALARKMRMYVLAVGGLSFVTSFFLLAQMFKEGTGLPEGTSAEHFTKPGIEFNVFAQKYLRAGEVKNIVFCPQAFKAVAYLHDGAVIDGQRVTQPFVVISYAQNAQQFWADVRKEEGLLGISLSNGVPITMYQGMTHWKVIELLIGLLIIAFLGTQYGRLLRQRVLAKRSGGGGGTPPPSQ